MLHNKLWQNSADIWTNAAATYVALKLLVNIPVLHRFTERVYVG